MDVKNSIMIITVIAIGFIMVSYLIPPGLDAVFGSDETREGLVEGETVSIHDDIDVTCDEHNTTGDYVVLTLKGPHNNDTVNVSLGEEVDAKLEPDEDGDLEMLIGTYYYHQHGDEAVVEFDIPRQFGWGKATRSLISTVTILLLITIMVSLVGYAGYILKTG